MRRHHATGPMIAAIAMAILLVTASTSSATTARDVADLDRGARDVAAQNLRAQDDDVDPTTTVGTAVRGQVPVNDIIPLPNSGQAPQRRGDRGGSGQLLVFFGMLGAIGIIGLLIRRESRRKLGTN